MRNRAFRLSRSELASLSGFPCSSRSIRSFVFMTSGDACPTDGGVILTTGDGCPTISGVVATGEGCPTNGGKSLIFRKKQKTCSFASGTVKAP